MIFKANSTQFTVYGHAEVLRCLVLIQLRIPLQFMFLFFCIAQKKQKSRLIFLSLKICRNNFCLRMANAALVPSCFRQRLSYCLIFYAHEKYARV